jgi:hypothetical protein
VSKGTPDKLIEHYNDHYQCADAEEERLDVSFAGCFLQIGA